MCFIFFVSSGGRGQHKKVVELLENVDASMSFDGWSVTECAIAFLLDANDRGIDGTLKEFREQYQEFLDVCRTLII